MTCRVADTIVCHVTQLCVTPLLVPTVMLFDILDEIFGRRSKVRLLRTLSSIDRAVSGREAARLSGLSHRAMVSLDDLVAFAGTDRVEAAVEAMAF